jgi:molecular chaperone IbpA
MRSLDFAPLYRSAIGFDRLAQLFDNMQRADAQPSYPPYNIELVAEDRYQITMAVAGFDRSELEIEAENDSLRITGRKQQAEQQRNFLHRGIGTRDFEHRFQLADHVRVTSAKLDKGLLHIDLIREVPEALKLRKIAIDGADLELLQSKAA